MGGRGRRKGNGEEGGATREGGLWADARGRRKKIPEREREWRMKKNRWRTHHRRVILQSDGDALDSITAGSYYERAVIRKHHRRVHLESAVIVYHRRFETNRR